jgi:hypothetical protein
VLPQCCKQVQLLVQQADVQSLVECKWLSQVRPTGSLQPSLVPASFTPALLCCLPQVGPIIINKLLCSHTQRNSAAAAVLSALADVQILNVDSYIPRFTDLDVQALSVASKCFRTLALPWAKIVRCDRALAGVLSHLPMWFRCHTTELTLPILPALYLNYVSAQWLQELLQEFPLLDSIIITPAPQPAMTAPSYPLAMEHHIARAVQHILHSCAAANRPVRVGVPSTVLQHVSVAGYGHIKLYSTA